MSEYKIYTLAPGTDTVPKFLREYLEIRCVHINTQQELYSGTVLGQKMYSEDIALKYKLE